MESFRKPPTVMIATKNRAPVIASAGNVVERVWVEDSQRASHSAVPYSGAGSQVQRSRFDNHLDGFSERQYGWRNKPTPTTQRRRQDEIVRSDRFALQQQCHGADR